MQAARNVELCRRAVTSHRRVPQARKDVGPFFLRAARKERRDVRETPRSLASLMPTVGTHADQWTRLDNARPCAIESSFLKPLREYTRRTVK